MRLHDNIADQKINTARLVIQKIVISIWVNNNVAK